MANPIQQGPTWFETANRIADEEKLRASKQAKIARVKFPHNNRFDAERHARWTYRMAKELGPILATIVGVGHEITELPWNFGEMSMDLHNNGVGVGQAQAGGAIPNVNTPGLIMAPKGKK